MMGGNGSHPTAASIASGLISEEEAEVLHGGNTCAAGS